MPHSAAGWRIEPPVSVPIAHGARPAATAAAPPPAPAPRARPPPVRAAAAAAARDALAVPRVQHRPVGRVLVRRAHGELVLVGLAEQRRADVLADGRGVRRLVALEDLRARLRWHARGAEE